MIGFVTGAALGYVLGTRAGRERYEQIRRQSRRLWHSEPVQSRVEQAGTAVKTQALPFVADKVGDAVKAAGRAVKDKAGRPTITTEAVETPEGGHYAQVTSAEDAARY